MSKQLFVNPDDLRKPGWIKFEKIPVCQYKKTIKEEAAVYSKDDFLRLYRDMRMIREFETMLYAIKTTNAYNGLEYNNPGPAHLSMGQEASSVGQAYLLNPHDYIFGSHRSHGEILAKGLSAINKLDEKELLSIMENFLGGAAYQVVEQANKGLPAGQYTRGDVLRVTLEVTSQADMTWVAITDPITGGATILGSGLGRDSEIASRGEKREGWAWPAFEERSFEAFRSYFEYMPKGATKLQYTLRLNNVGDFALPPTRVEAMYAPEMFGEAPNARVKVEAAK